MLNHQHYNSELREWNGARQPSIWNPHSSIGSILYFCLSQHPEKVAQIFVDDGSSMTYEALRVASVRVALNLQKLGIKQGDVVSIMCYNNKNVWSLLLGCIFNGAPLSVLSLDYDQGMTPAFLRVYLTQSF